jgi:carbonic anhydrase
MFLLILLGLCESFNYQNHGSDWSDGECPTGSYQSPINIINEAANKANSIKLSFNLNEVQVEGEKLSYTYKILGSFGTLNATKQSLSFSTATILQLHFHGPSENHIDGAEHPLEMHIVMADDQKKFTYIVYGIFFDVGQNQNEFIAKVIQTYDNSINLSLESILQSPIDNFYVFLGSLTTPNCSGGVLWIVDSKPRSISFDQLQFFNSFWKDNQTFANGNGNNRAIQSTNNRTIVFYSSSLYLKSFLGVLLILLS